MVMHYVGGGIGHFNQCAPIDKDSEVMETYTIDNEAEDVELECDQMSTYDRTGEGNGNKDVTDNTDNNEDMMRYLEDELLGVKDNYESGEDDTNSAMGEDDDCIKDLYDL
ncbi:hypothetical protein CTheo_9140 [Ceratobasidium theobromae]|uniref:Uncharacterized protein n=1 Tax=Ceratobasidium theobromae TaxID=1582974 RepID=A0A5N5Q662_9AGAM|nr:hypothetical protein CTheo_9140 [Ceratobasidium theobromae]